MKLLQVEQETTFMKLHRKIGENNTPLVVHLNVLTLAAIYQLLLAEFIPSWDICNEQSPMMNFI